jgi:competence protein ComEA
MSDLPPELPRPAPPRTWRDHLAGAIDLFDVSPRRLAVGAVALACVGVVGWRMLAPPDAPAEMRLPFAGSSAGSTGGGDDGSAPADGAPGAATDGSPGASGASAAGVATSGLPTELVVHVVGAVAAPGIQRLPPGSRVVDALAAAGDALPDADLARINLAAPLIDGQQVFVPRPGEPAPSTLAPAGGGTGITGGGPGGTGATGTAQGGLVNLNTATAQELEALPGVGPSTAAAIIAHRDANGPFTSVEQLIDVRGIGDAKLEQLRQLVTV